MKTLVCPNRDSELRLDDADDSRPEDHHCVSCGRPMAQGESFEGVDHLNLIPDPKKPREGFEWPGQYVGVAGGYKG